MPSTTFSWGNPDNADEIVVAYNDTRAAVPAHRYRTKKQTSNAQRPTSNIISLNSEDF